jgi:NAD(P)-dependent dehydrogenase (short-subunit alcohol dehydrogenase family)
MGRLAGKVAVVIGAGQNEGETIGNGRATSLRFVEEGASLLAVDRSLASARSTVELCAGADVEPFEADVRDGATLKAAIEYAKQRWGRVDVLHYNVGVSILGNDQPLDQLTEEIFDSVNAVNLRGFLMAAKHVEPIMREQASGVVLGVSSMSAIETSTPFVTYRTSKMGMIAFVQQFAMRNAEFGIRANAILPGRVETATALDAKVKRSGRTREELSAERAALTPLKGRTGTAFDVANAAVFLASEEAGFVTGVTLPVDGGALVKIGW